MAAIVITHNMIVEDECDDSMFDKGWQLKGELAEPEHGATSFE
jgi:hypothetical protein